MTLELAILLSVMWVSSLGFAAYMVYLTKHAKLPEKEIERLQGEMNSLALSVGLRRATQHQGPPPGMGMK